MNMSSSLPSSSARNRDNIIGLNKLFNFLEKKEKEKKEEKEEENKCFYESFENFVDLKLTKYPLNFEKSDSKKLEKICQMDNGGFIALVKEIKEITETKPIISDQMTILKTKETNQKKEVVSKNIENELTMTTIETKYKIIIKDKYYNEIYSEEIEDINPFFFEIKENGSNFAIICENNNLHKVLIKSSGIDLNPPRDFYIEMKIFLILQIGDVEYIISNDKGVYYYEGLINHIKPNKLIGKRISEKSFKKGVNLGSKILIFLDNENQQGCLYTKLNDTIIKNEIFDYPFILETFIAFNYKENEENNTTNKIALCAYKIESKNYGIALIRERENIIEIYKFEFKFIIKSICPLQNIIKDNNNILSVNNNTKIIDSNYIIIIGENNDEVEMGIYKIKNLDNYPNIELITYLSCDKIDKNLEEIKFVIQSLQKGNLIVEYYNKDSDYLYFEEDD